MDNNLKNLINQNYTGTPTTTGASTSNTMNYTQYGWKCPICGAVMSPWMSTCINCRGNQQYPYIYQEWQNPYYAGQRIKLDVSKVTCEMPKVTFGQ